MDVVKLIINAHLSSDILLARTSGDGPVVCPIWLSLDTYQFPSAEWSDFAVVILSWWLEQARDLQSGKIAEAHFRFMDGPYELTVSVVHGDHWAVVPLARDLNEAERLTYVVLGTQVLRELERASLLILDECRLAGKWDKDCMTLEALCQV